VSQGASVARIAQKTSIKHSSDESETLFGETKAAQCLSRSGSAFYGYCGMVLTQLTTAGLPVFWKIQKLRKCGLCHCARGGFFNRDFVLSLVSTNSHGRISTNRKSSIPARRDRPQHATGRTLRFVIIGRAVVGYCTADRGANTFLQADRATSDFSGKRSRYPI